MNKNIFPGNTSNKELNKNGSYIEEMFPGCNNKSGDYSYFRAPSYSSIVAQFCDEVIIETWENDYQGSTYCLLRKGSQYGYLEFGWGSCSRCDALEACSNYKELQSLFESLESSIQWFDSKEAFHTWFKERDWKGQFSWHDGVQEFIKDVNKYFGE